jgi:dTDP-glucose 4,6-dehydratase
MHCLVAGAAGFLGSHFCDRLLAEGHAVTGVDNYVTGRKRNLSHLEGHARFGFVEQDITRPFGVEARVDCVLNLASPASPKDYLEHPVETLLVGSLGTKNLLDLALAHGAAILLASTSECYGDPLEHPQKETYWGNVNPIGPRSCYDESKRFAEAMTMAYRRKHGARTRIARIFNTYGPRMKLDDGRVVPALVGQALAGEPMTVFGDGSQTRSFCYAEDLIDGLWRLAQSDFGEPVNIGNPAEMTVLEFAEKIRAVTGTRSEIEFRPLPQDDPQRRRPDITRAREVLGWAPKTTLEEGLRPTIEYFRGVA